MNQLFSRSEERNDPGSLKVGFSSLLFTVQVFEVLIFQVLYFLKVIELFDKFGYYDFVVELAKTALAVCDSDNPNKVSLLYSTTIKS